MKTVTALLFIACMLTACHTIHGAGQDIQQGGRAISNAAHTS